MFGYLGNSGLGKPVLTLFFFVCVCVCLDFHLSRLYYHPGLRLLWCPVFKAASTVWLNNFIILSEHSQVSNHGFATSAR